jgi:hypothetical protein
MYNSKYIYISNSDEFQKPEFIQAIEKRFGNKDSNCIISTAVATVLIGKRGRAIAQAVSRRLPTAAARVQTRVWSCGIL